MRKKYPVYDPEKKRKRETLEEYIVRFFDETKEAQEYRATLPFNETYPIVQTECTAM